MPKLTAGLLVALLLTVPSVLTLPSLNLSLLQAGPALKRQSSGDSSSHILPGLSRAASQESHKGRHSRASSLDQSDSPEHSGPSTRSLPRI